MGLAGPLASIALKIYATLEYLLVDFATKPLAPWQGPAMVTIAMAAIGGVIDYQSCNGLLQ